MYATVEELEAYVGSSQTLPVDESDQGEAERLLTRASELLDDVTFNRAAAAFAGDDATVKAHLSKATCAQVEFWLEWGEDHDIVAYRGGVTTGKLSLTRLPKDLAPRALRHLRAAGLLTAMAPIAGGLLVEETKA